MCVPVANQVAAVRNGELHRCSRRNCCACWRIRLSGECGVRDMQVDVRVVAASNRDLESAVREGQFRQDLFYRLAIIAIFIPPLRERKEDILPLVDSSSIATIASSKNPSGGWRTKPADRFWRIAGPERARTEEHDRASHDSRGRAIPAAGVSALLGGRHRWTNTIRAHGGFLTMGKRLPVAAGCRGCVSLRVTLH